MNHGTKSNELGLSKKKDQTLHKIFLKIYYKNFLKSLLDSVMSISLRSFGTFEYLNEIELYSKILNHMHIA